MAGKINWNGRSRQGKTVFPLLKNTTASRLVQFRYSVVVGLDDTYIHLQDPELGHLRKFTRPDFLRVWFDFPGDSLESPNDLVLRQLIAISPTRA